MSLNIVADRFGFNPVDGFFATICGATAFAMRAILIDMGYIPMQVGLSFPRFQALMDCKKNVEYMCNLPDDIFKYICNLWLEGEANDSRKRLLLA